MALVVDALVGILRKPTTSGVLTELAFFCGQLSVAVIVGLVVGWMWKPKWASGLAGDEKEEPVGGDSRRFPPPSSSDALRNALGLLSFESLKAQLPTRVPYLIQHHAAGDGLAERDTEGDGAKLAVVDADFQHLVKLVDERDGGPAWIQMMDRSLPNMTYQAWRRDPQTGPPQYRSRTVFEDATPETVREFFWDDDFRIKAKWDDMLLHHTILEECSVTGTMVVHWIRKFPFFCSDREYTIGRRIWNMDGAYYCVTKGIPCADVPRRSKPRRVDLYYSSWCIRAAESKRDGRRTKACEVILFHHEDMGIPWELAKLGVRQGMWGTVKKIEPGLRAYQSYRESGVEPSRCALMARVNTKVSAAFPRRGGDNAGVPSEPEVEDEHDGEDLGMRSCRLPRFVLLGAAVALACTQRGLLTKAVIFGVASKFAKPGR